MRSDWFTILICVSLAVSGCSSSSTKNNSTRNPASVLESEKIHSAFEAGKSALSHLQNEDGSFTKLVLSSSSIYSTTQIFLYEYLGIVEKKREIVDGLLMWTWRQQAKDGGFPGYSGGESNVGISAQVYVAARIAGESEETSRMKDLAQYMRKNGGFKEASTARPYLMAFGIDSTPGCIPGFAENLFIRLDNRMPWIRNLAIPFLHIYSSGHIHPLSADKFPHALGKIGSCPELFSTKKQTPGKKKFWTWIEKSMNEDGTLFDYAPTTVPGLMALSTAGDRYADLIQKGIATLESFQIHYPDGSIYQSSGDAAVGETLVVLNALIYSGVSPQDATLKKAEQFILQAQHPATGGFGMAKNSRKFPDSDDSSTALHALRTLGEIKGSYRGPENSEFRARLLKGVDWVLTLQNKDGGFATWEKDRTPWLWGAIRKRTGIVLSESVLEHSARAAAMLALYRDDDPHYAQAHDRVLKFILKKQLPDGSYPGTWFLDYLFGTSMAITALASAPEDQYLKSELQTSIEKSLDYLAENQRSDGGFSESPDSYIEKKTVPLAFSSPTQTGLIVSALLGFSELEKYRHWAKISPMIERATTYLLSTQKEDGLWHDTAWTGVTFPKVEYLIYQVLQEAMPVQALGMVQQLKH